MKLNLNHLKRRPNFQLLRFADGHYMGDLVNGLRHGLGVMIYKSGRRYEGHWAND